MNLKWDQTAWLCDLFFHIICVSTAEKRLEFKYSQVRITEGESEGLKNWECMQESDRNDGPYDVSQARREVRLTSGQESKRWK